MNALLARVFQLEAADRGRVFAFMLLGGLLQAGLAIGISAGDSLFLVKVGASKLPVIYVTMPMLMALYIPTYSHLLGRYGINRVFDLTMGLIVAGSVLFYVLLGQSSDPAVLYAVKYWGALWYIGLYTLFWNFIDGYFDLTKAKRLFGLLAAGPALGAIAGGWIVNQLAEPLGVPALFLIWAGVGVAALPVLRLIRRRYQPLPATAPGAAPTRAAFRDTLARIGRSRYISVLVVVLFLTLVTATICEYQYLSIFSAATDEETLAGLFGQLFAAVNLFNLCMTLFVFHQLVQRIGVRNTALIQPVTYLIVFVLLLLNGGFGAALLGFLAYQGIMTSIDYNNVNLLFNGLPEEGKSQVRTFVEGICEPLSTATAGVFLFFLAPHLGPENVSAIGLICAAVLLGAVFVLRADYTRSMIANVRRSWLDFSAPVESSLTGLTEADLALLEARIDRPIAGERFTALQVLWLNAPSRALMRMFNLLPQARPEERRAAQPLLAMMLSAKDPALLLQTLAWSERHADRADPLLLEELGRQRLVTTDSGVARVQARAPGVRAAGASLLWRSSRLPDGRAALDTVDALLRAGAEETLAGIHALGRMGEPRFAPHLLPHLQSRDPAVRLEALQALRQIANQESTRLVPPLLDLLAAGGTTEERQLVLELIGRMADSTSVAPLLALAGRFSPRERRQTEQLIIGFGPRAVATLVMVVQNPNFPSFARSIALRALGHLAFPQLEALAPALIDNLVRRAYLLAGCSAALQRLSEPGTGIAMLTLVYRDLPRLALEMLLEVLSVTGRLPGYDSVVAALRSDQPRERGYALENIEQGCGRRLFADLAPFFEGRTHAEVAAHGGRRGFISTVTPGQAIERSLAVHLDLEAASALQASVELQPAQASGTILDLLRRKPVVPLLRETALTLLARIESGTTSALTPIERVHRLSRNDFFRDWDVLPFNFLGQNLREVSFAPGAPLHRAGDTAEGVHLLLRGTVHRSAFAHHPATVLYPGDLSSTEALFGEPRHLGTAQTAEGCATLYLAAADVFACARIHAPVAANLLRRKLTTA